MPVVHIEPMNFDFGLRWFRGNKEFEFVNSSSVGIFVRLLKTPSKASMMESLQDRVLLETKIDSNEDFIHLMDQDRLWVTLGYEENDIRAEFALNKGQRLRITDK